MFEFEFYDNKVSFINKIMKFFLYYFNYSEFNLENSGILYFGTYTIYTNQMSTTTNQNSLIAMTDFIRHILKEDNIIREL